MKDTLTNVLLSIKPKYACAIVDGAKKVEFRKKIFKRPIDKVYVYSSSPHKKIIGYFTIQEIVEDHPEKLWQQFNEFGNINENDFFQYFNNHNNGFSIVIDKVVKFDDAIEPSDFFNNFNAPQSYFYLQNEITI